MDLDTSSTLDINHMLNFKFVLDISGTCKMPPNSISSTRDFLNVSRESTMAHTLVGEALDVGKVAST